MQTRRWLATWIDELLWGLWLLCALYQSSKAALELGAHLILAASWVVLLVFHLSWHSGSSLRRAIPDKSQRARKQLGSFLCVLLATLIAVTSAATGVMLKTRIMLCSHELDNVLRDSSGCPAGDPVVLGGICGDSLYRPCDAQFRSTDDLCIFPPAFPPLVYDGGCGLTYLTTPPIESREIPCNFIHLYENWWWYGCWT